MNQYNKDVTISDLENKLKEVEAKKKHFFDEHLRCSAVDLKYIKELEAKLANNLTLMIEQGDYREEIMDRNVELEKKLSEAEEVFQLQRQVSFKDKEKLKAAVEALNKDKDSLKLIRDMRIGHYESHKEYWEDRDHNIDNALKSIDEALIKTREA